MSKTVERLAHEMVSALQRNGHLPLSKSGQPILTIALLQAEVDFLNVANTVIQAVSSIDRPGPGATDQPGTDIVPTPEPRPGSEAADLVAAARADSAA